MTEIDDWDISEQFSNSEYDQKVKDNQMFEALLAKYNANLCTVMIQTMNDEAIDVA